jgi:SAM-dependent methyltransferase
MTPLQQQLGNTDIYLIDQLLRGRIQPGMKILDAGCGEGRNIRYLISQGYDVSAVDQDPQRIPGLPPEKFRCEPIESMSFPDASFDFIIASAVLHFAHDEAHFEAMLSRIFDKLRPGGILFCRLASSIGIEHQIQQISGRCYLLPDGSDRFLVDAELLHHIAEGRNLQLLDPIKTTIVENQRAMTTWVLLKSR